MEPKNGSKSNLLHGYRRLVVYKKKEVTFVDLENDVETRLIPQFTN